MRFRPGSVIRLEHDIGAIVEGDYVVIAAVGPWLRIGRLAEDVDGQLVAGGIVADVPACALAEYARPLGVEAEVEKD